MKMVRIITPADIQQRDNISMSKQTNERWQIWYCWPCTRCSEIWVTDMRGKLNSSTQKLFSSLLYKFVLNSAEFKMFCTLAPACQDSDYVNLSYQTFKVVKLSSKLMSKRDFNAFLQIHVSVFCAEPSINILDQLSCLGLVFVIFTYILVILCYLLLHDIISTYYCIS